VVGFKPIANQLPGATNNVTDHRQLALFGATITPCEYFRFETAINNQPLTIYRLMPLVKLKATPLPFYIYA
jgi:hypothetical protein